MGLDNLPDIITRQQLAEILKVNQMTIFRALKKGELKGFKVGKKWRIEKKEVLQWIESKTKT